MSAAPYSLRATLVSTLASTKRPDVPVIVALRNTVGVVLPLAVGFACGHPTAGIGVAAGALNVMFSDQAGAYRQRLQVIVLVSLAAALSALLGFLIGAHAWASIVSVLLAGFIGGLLVVFGPNMARVGMTSMILLVIAAASPLPWRDALGASALILTGGLLQAMLSIAAWPLQRYRPERLALETVYRELATLARNKQPDTDAPAASDTLTALQHTLLGRHHARGRAMEAFCVLLELAERIRLELMALDTAPGETPADGPASMAIADVLEAIASALHDGESPVRAERLLQTLRTRAGREHPRFDALIGQLAAATRNANWAGSRGELRAREAENTLPKSLRSGAPWAILRANLGLHSVAFRHAVRWTACVAMAMLVARHAGLPHGYWMPMTAAIVLRPDFSATFKFGLLRVLGTVLGLILTTGLLWLTPNDIWAHLALMAVLCFAFRYLATAHYGMGVAALTGTVVILLAFEGVASGTAVIDRVINTALGSGMAMLAYLLWPTWERGRAREALADMFASYAQYLQSLTNSDSTAGARRNARAAARSARSNAQASLARLQNEPGTDPDLIAMADNLLANGNRLARTAMALEAHLDSLHASPARADLEWLLGQSVAVVSGVAEHLKSRKPLEPVPELRARQGMLVAPMPRDAPLRHLSDRLVSNLDTLIHVLNRQPVQPLAAPANH